MDDTQKEALANLLVNHENRLNQIEHEVGILEGRMPKSKLRRLVWWPYTAVFLLAPVVGAWATLFGQEPWKDGVIIFAFLILSGRAYSEFLGRIAKGPRPHRSMIRENHR